MMVSYVGGEPAKEQEEQHYTQYQQRKKKHKLITTHKKNENNVSSRTNIHTKYLIFQSFNRRTRDGHIEAHGQRFTVVGKTTISLLFRWAVNPNRVFHVIMDIMKCR